MAPTLSPPSYLIQPGLDKVGRASRSGFDAYKARSCHSLLRQSRASSSLHSFPSLLRLPNLRPISSILLHLAACLLIRFISSSTYTHGPTISLCFYVRVTVKHVCICLQLPSYDERIIQSEWPVIRDLVTQGLASERLVFAQWKSPILDCTPTVLITAIGFLRQAKDIILIAIFVRKTKDEITSDLLCMSLIFFLCRCAGFFCVMRVVIRVVMGGVVTCLLGLVVWFACTTWIRCIFSRWGRKLLWHVR